MIILRKHILSAVLALGSRAFAARPPQVPDESTRGRFKKGGEFEGQQGRNQPRDHGRGQKVSEDSTFKTDYRAKKRAGGYTELDQRREDWKDDQKFAQAKAFHNFLREMTEDRRNWGQVKYDHKVGKEFLPILLGSVKVPVSLLRAAGQCVWKNVGDPTVYLQVVKEYFLNIRKELGGITRLDEIAARLTGYSTVYQILFDVMRSVRKYHEIPDNFEAQMKDLHLVINGTMIALFSHPLGKNISFLSFTFFIGRMAFALKNARVQDKTFSVLCLRTIKQNLPNLRLVNDHSLPGLVFMTAHEGDPTLQADAHALCREIIKEIRGRFLTGTFKIRPLAFLLRNLSNSPQFILLELAEDKEFARAIRETILKNLQWLNVREMSVIAHSLLKLEWIDDRFIIRRKFIQRMNATGSNDISNLLNLDLYSFIIGCRPLFLNLEKIEEKEREAVKQFLNKLLENFVKSVPIYKPNLLVRILYEWTHVIKIVSKPYFNEHFRNYALKASHRMLNLFDLIALSYIMKKYIKITPDDFTFWRKMLASLQHHKITSKIEYERIDLMYRNLMDYLRKGIPPADAAPVEQRNDGTVGSDKDVLAELESNSELVSDWALAISEKYEQFLLANESTFKNQAFEKDSLTAELHSRELQEDEDMPPEM
jgi:hypothetical protein